MVTLNYFDAKADEHNIISDYCSKLSEFYADYSTHLTQYPNENSIESKKNNIVSSKNLYFSSDDKERSILNKSRSISLHRNLSHIDKSKTNRKFALNGLNERKSVKNAIRSLSETNFCLNEFNNKKQDEIFNDLKERKKLEEKKEIVSKLEKKNKEILKQIEKLRLNNLSRKSIESSENLIHQYINIKTVDSKLENCEYSLQIANSSTNNNTYFNPIIVGELETLKQHKEHLENRMIMLELSRDKLIHRLTKLDTLITPYIESKLN